MKYPNLELIEYITANIVCNTCDCLSGSGYHKFRMYVFPQTWASTALGFDEHGGFGGQAFTDAYTTIVEMTWNDFKTREKSDDKIYAVFFDGKFAYMCLNPTEMFFEDLNKRQMKSQREAKIHYEDYKNE